MQRQRGHGGLRGSVLTRIVCRPAPGRRGGPIPVIEALASIVVGCRFTGARTLSATAERRAQVGVAVSLFLLAPYVGYEAIDKLAAQHHAETTGDDPAGYRPFRPLLDLDGPGCRSSAWLDPTVALVIAALAVWEGIEAQRDEDD